MDLRDLDPDDDVIPDVLGEHMDIDVYSTTAAEPYDLMNTGGNYMSDGFGLAFGSELILAMKIWRNDLVDDFP